MRTGSRCYNMGPCKEMAREMAYSPAMVFMMNEYNTSKTCCLSVDPMKPDESHEVTVVNNSVKGCFQKCTDQRSIKGCCCVKKFVKRMYQWI